MSPCGLLLLAFLLHTGQVIHSRIGACLKTFYLCDGSCKQCPNHCEICSNTTQCTSCQMGYYGQICENECEVGCTRTCHKVYGHCTYGCSDGEYADLKSLSCLPCSNKCKVCRSLISCVECSPGYYGEACLKQCPGLCKGRLCNATDGSCFDCDDGFYKVDRDCIACPDGCAQCNDSTTCTVCSDGFIGPIHGRCFLECLAINEHKNDTVCNTGLCRNLSANWKLPVSECHQAMLHSSECFTEGVCGTLTNNQLNLELNSHDDVDYSPIYRTFKCSLKCSEHAIWYTCVLEEPADNNILEIEQNNRMGDKLLAETWVKSHCTLGRPHDSQATTLKTAIIYIGTLVCIVLSVALVMFYCKRLLVIKKKESTKKKESNENEQLPLNEVPLLPTIPQSTIDDDISNAKVEFIGERNLLSSVICRIYLSPGHQSRIPLSSEGDICGLNRDCICEASGTVQEPEKIH